MKRFFMIIILILNGCLVFTLCTRPTSDEGNSIKPNMVFILIENIRTELSCYGEPIVQTPNIDKLATEGVLFNQVFTTSSVCAPSRAAMITGAYQIKTNTQNLRMNRDRQLPPPYQAFTYYLREGGYFIALGCGYCELST